MKNLEENVFIQSIEYLEELDDISLNESVPLNVKTQSIRVSNLLFAKAVQECGSILFNKKQTHQMKELKKEALKAVTDYILVQKNIVLSEEHIYKKLNNMKTRVKSKLEVHRSGKEVKLNEGEKIISNLMATVESSTISDQESAGDSHVFEDNFDAPSTRFESSYSVNEPVQHMSSDLTAVQVPMKRKYDETEQAQEDTDSVDPSKLDTVDRSKMNVSELKKLVLLKKLEVLEVQKKVFEKTQVVLDLIEKGTLFKE